MRAANIALATAALLLVLWAAIDLQHTWMR